MKKDIGTKRKEREKESKRKVRLRRKYAPKPVEETPVEQEPKYLERNLDFLKQLEKTFEEEDRIRKEYREKLNAGNTGNSNDNG